MFERGSCIWNGQNVCDSQDTFQGSPLPFLRQRTEWYVLPPSEHAYSITPAQTYTSMRMPGLKNTTKNTNVLLIQIIDQTM